MNIKSRNGIVYFETVDGDEMKFKLDFNAIADLEALMDKGINSLIADENIGFNIIRGFYWAGLRFADKGMTVQRAGNFVQKELNGGRSFEELMEPVVKGLSASGIIKEQSTDEDAEEVTDEDDGIDESSKN